MLYGDALEKKTFFISDSNLQWDDIGWRLTRVMVVRQGS
jgi:hypothetical protein